MAGSIELAMAEVAEFSVDIAWMPLSLDTTLSELIDFALRFEIRFEIRFSEE